MADRRLTDVELERWLAGDLPEGRQRTASEADQARLEELRSQHAAWLGTIDVAAELRGIAAKQASVARPAPATRFAAWKWALSGGALAAAAAAVLLLVVRPGDSGDDVLRSKGDGVSLVVYMAREAGPAHRLASGDTVVPGDKIRFEVTVTRAGYVAVVGIDGTGVGTVYYPFGGHAPVAVDPGSGGVLPGAIALDATPGDERFYAVYADVPFAIDARLFAGLRGGAVLGDLATAAVVLHKKPAPL